MIDEKEFLWHEEGRFHYVTFDMIEKSHTPQQADDFKAWISDQTVGMAPDCEAAIYSWDYKRWCAQGMLTEQCGDWD